MRHRYHLWEIDHGHLLIIINLHPIKEKLLLQSDGINLQEIRKPISSNQKKKKKERKQYTGNHNSSIPVIEKDKCNLPACDGLRMMMGNLKPRSKNAYHDVEFIEVTMNKPMLSQTNN